MIDKVAAELAHVVGVDAAQVEGLRVAGGLAALLAEAVVGGAAARIVRRHLRQNVRPLGRRRGGGRQEEVILEVWVRVGATAGTGRA